MPRYFLTLSYDGSEFNGWQIQENTPNTVEQVLEEKFAMLLKEKVDVVGCGRTDTGVNARNFVAHLDTNTELEKNRDHWIYKLNTVLPPSVAVQRITRVHDSAHARFDAIERAYYYFVNQHKDPFRYRFSWHISGELDFEKMNRAAELLYQYTDFGCFSKSNTQVKTNICSIRKANWQKTGDSEWRFHIRADRFLRGMVRAIVGTLVMVGKHKISIEGFRNIIESRDRKVAGSNAPPNGLFFCGVSYPPTVFDGKEQKEN